MIWRCVRACVRGCGRGLGGIGRGRGWAHVCGFGARGEWVGTGAWIELVRAAGDLES